MELERWLQKIRRAVLNDRPYADALVEDYLSSLLATLERFRFQSGLRIDRRFSDMVRENVAGFLPYRNNYVDVLLFLGAYRFTPRVQGGVFRFLEKLLSFLSPPECWTEWMDSLFDNYRFLAGELFLYTIATLIRCRQYAFVARLIEAEYCCQDPLGAMSYRSCGIDGFCERVKSLDEFRQGELLLSAEHATADLLLERANHGHVQFADLLEVDILLLLREYFPDPEHAGNWIPRCAAHCEDATTLPLFAQAASGLGWEPLKHLLRIQSPLHLAICLSKLFDQGKFQRLLQQDTYWHVDWHTLLNVDKIRQRAKEDPAGYLFR